VTRPIALALIASLAAPSVMACALPPQETPVSACALVRLAEGHVCIDDPSAPGGYRIEARATGAVREPAVAGPEG
jgi:hypothetical protein